METKKKDKAKENMMRKSNFEIMFKDSPDYFLVENAKMVFESQMIRFICFDENDEFKYNVWYPMNNIYRVKSYNF